MRNIGRNAVSPVVATMILIIVVITSVGTFAYLLSAAQSTADKQGNQILNVLNENLQVTNVQTYPTYTRNLTYINGMNITVRNNNVQTSAVNAIEINGNFSLLNNTRIYPHESTTFEVDNLSLTRTESIGINVITASQNIFSFSVQPPTAMFDINQSQSDIFNATGSSSPDSTIHQYDWDIDGFNQMTQLIGCSDLTGSLVEFVPFAYTTIVTLTVVDGYGLISRQVQTLSNAISSRLTSANSCGGVATIPPSISCVGSANSTDLTDFVCPYLDQIEGIREELMNPYQAGRGQSYGYDATMGLVCGGNVEASQAIGVLNGYNNLCVITDNNIEGGTALDFLNSGSSPLMDVLAFSSFNQANYPNGDPASNIILNNGTLPGNYTAYYLTTDIATDSLSKVRNALSQTWDGVGGCTTWSPQSYPSSFPLLDRREGEYGFTDPYASILLTPGVHLGGIGQSCGTEGQTWYIPGDGGFFGSATSYDACFSSAYLQPCVVAEMPGTPIGPYSDLEELSFYIDEAYMQYIAGNAPASLWQNAYKNAMSQYPFDEPRQALHFIQVTRATQAWTLTGFTVDGFTPLQMLEIAIQQVLTPETQMGPMGVFGDLGPNGNAGLSQQWGVRGFNTPEANMQAMVAFDPQMPLWFTTACYNYLIDPSSFTASPCPT